jgi:hypothetical protein
VSDLAQRAEETFGFRAVPLKPVLLIQSIMVFLADSPLTVAFLVLRSDSGRRSVLRSLPRAHGHGKSE